jgi:hypothetical protein
MTHGRRTWRQVHVNCVIGCGSYAHPSFLCLGGSPIAPVHLTCWRDLCPCRRASCRGIQEGRGERCCVSSQGAPSVRAKKLFDKSVDGASEQWMGRHASITHLVKSILPWSSKTGRICARKSFVILYERITHLDCIMCNDFLTNSLILQNRGRGEGVRPSGNIRPVMGKSAIETEVNG